MHCASDWPRMSWADRRREPQVLANKVRPKTSSQGAVILRAGNVTAILALHLVRCLCSGWPVTYTGCPAAVFPTLLSPSSPCSRTAIMRAERWTTVPSRNRFMQEIDVHNTRSGE